MITYQTGQFGKGLKDEMLIFLDTVAAANQLPRETQILISSVIAAVLVSIAIVVLIICCR